MVVRMEPSRQPGLRRSAVKGKMNRMKRLFPACLVALLLAWARWRRIRLGKLPSTVVFSEPGFPAADSATPPAGALEAALPEARFRFCGTAWSGVGECIDAAAGSSLWIRISGGGVGADLSISPAGGNLLVLGGRPFTRAGYRDAGVWKLREYGMRFALRL